MALYTPSGNPVNASRGLASVLRAEFALIAAGINAVAAEVLTLTNKTINLTSNTLTGTKAQFNTACSDGNFLYDGGDLGTPSAGVLTNCTGTAAGLTAGSASVASAVAVGGITGLGTGVATFLATPSSANFASAVTGETGSGALVFGTSPTIDAPVFTGVVDNQGGQIKFPATQSASADANTLDDYEEGTWTPSLTCGTSGTITLTVDSARYTKIGRQVTVTAELNVSSVSSPTGQISLFGLPVAAGTGGALTIIGEGILSGTCVGAIVASGQSFGVLMQASGAAVQGSQIDGNAYFYISGSYFV